MDLVQDRTADGRLFRMLVVLDECTREYLAIEVHRHLRGEDIVAVLDELTAIRGAPAHVRALGKVNPAAFAATCPALPPLRLAELSCAAASSGTQRATTTHQLS